MDNIIIKRHEKGLNGASQKNTICAFKDGQLLATACLYPHIPKFKTEYEHNIFLDITSDNEVIPDYIKDMLIKEAKIRAIEIKKKDNQKNTRLYTCFFSSDKDKIDFYASRGFAHDEGMYIMKWKADKHLPIPINPNDIQIKKCKMEREEEQLNFIEIHKRYFTTHYTCEVINKLSKQPLWMNFTAFSNNEIVGNIMLFEEKTNTSKARKGIIEDLFIHTDWRRKGIAKYLANLSLNYFKEHGVNEVELEAWSANKNAIALYKSLGFQVVDESETALGVYL